MPGHRKTAFDYRDRLQNVFGWSDDDLRRLPIWEGDRFEDGEVYFNLNMPEVGPFRPGSRDSFSQEPIRGYLYVAKGEVPDHVWLRLVDSWGSRVPMGNMAPKPGAFGREQHPEVRSGRSDTDSMSSGDATLESAGPDDKVA